MNSNQWDNLKKDMARAKKLMQQAGVPGILLQLRWGSLSKAQRKKIEQAAKGKGWFEEKEEVVTAKGTETKAPKHRKAALKAHGDGAINEPIEVEEPTQEETAKEEWKQFNEERRVKSEQENQHKKKQYLTTEPEFIIVKPNSRRALERIDTELNWKDNDYIEWKQYDVPLPIGSYRAFDGRYYVIPKIIDISKIKGLNIVKELPERARLTFHKKGGKVLYLIKKEATEEKLIVPAKPPKQSKIPPKLVSWLNKYKKIQGKVNDISKETDAIVATSGMGQAPPIFHRLVNKQLDIIKKDIAPIWDNIKRYVVPGSNKTFWQEIYWTFGTLPPDYSEIEKVLHKYGVKISEREINEKSNIKEPPLITDPLRKSYDPTFEQTEDERMKEEGERERDIGIIEAEETIGAKGYDPITGEQYPDQNEYSQSPEEEEFSDLLAEAILIGAINSLEEKYEWQGRFNHNYPRNTDSATKKLQELIEAHEKKQKPKGKRASEALITLYPEEHYFGTEVTVVTEEGVVDYTGKILRLLNGGMLAEVRPSGNRFKGSSFRVPIEQVYVNKVVETPKEPPKNEPEPTTSPKIAISKTDSHSVYLVGDVKERSFVALANIIVTEDGKILELPGMDYMKGRDYPSENFNFTTVNEYLKDLKAKKEEVKRKQQEEKEAYEKKEAEIKERLSKPPSGYFIHKQDEQGDPLLEPVTEKVYPFEYQGIDLFAFKDTKGWNNRTSWNVSERRTGLFVSGGRTKAETIQKAKELIDKKGAGEIKRQIKVALGKMGA